MPDPWTAAWEEAETTAPPTILIYNTIELRHPAFTDGITPFAVRAVEGSLADVTLTLELDAVMNPGAAVVFKAIPFFTELPQFEEGKTPETMITVDNVAREMIPYLEQAVAMRADMQATYRQYRSDMITAPCYGPVTFNVKQVKVTGTRVTGTARIDDLANQKFPKKVYTIAEYPGLLP